MVAKFFICERILSNWVYYFLVVLLILLLTTRNSEKYNAIQQTLYKTKIGQ